MPQDGASLDGCPVDGQENCMKSRSLSGLPLTCGARAGAGANKEIRTCNGISPCCSSRSKTSNSSQDEKLAARDWSGTQSTVDAANDANTSVAVITSNIEKNLRDQTEQGRHPRAASPHA